MQTGIYRAFTLLLDPVISSGVSIRSRCRGESEKFRLQKRASAMPPRPQGKVIWFHGASIGEIVSVMPLIDKLRHWPEVTILVTSGTHNAAKALPQRLPKNVVHQTLPVDTPPKIQRFLNHWRPSCGLLVESEIWPNLIYYAKKTGVPLVLLNARMSPRSYERWSRVRRFAEELFNSISICFAQDAESATYFKSLGVRQALSIGNLKTFAPPLTHNESALSQLRDSLSGRPVWLAASTHEGEEHLVAEAHQLLKRSFPNLLTIVVPRHPARSPEIIGILENCGKVSCRSKSVTIDQETEFYVADTFGELGTFYSLSRIVLIGATLVPKGGHNPMEAARLGCAIIHGRHIDKNKQIYETLRANEASIQVESPEDIARWVKRLLDEEWLANELGNRALALAAKGEDVLLETLAIIKREVLQADVHSTSLKSTAA